MAEANSLRVFGFTLLHGTYPQGRLSLVGAGKKAVWSRAFWRPRAADPARPLR